MEKQQQINTGSMVRQRIFLIGLLVKRNIRNKYYRSVIGILWSVLNPLLHTFVMWFVFSNLFGRAPINNLHSVLYILSGNIVFGLLSEATSTALGSIVNKKGLLLSSPVPMEIFPLSSVFSSLASFAFSFISMLVIMVIFQFTGSYSFCWQIILIVTILPAEIVMSIGISFFLSTCYVFFRDIQHIYSVFLMLWRYLTPIFYSIDRITDPTFNKLMNINPMYHFVDAFRGFLTGEIPSWTTYLYIYGFAIVVLVLGWLFMRALKNKISAQL